MRSIFRRTVEAWQARIEETELSIVAFNSLTSG